MSPTDVSAEKNILSWKRHIPTAVLALAALGLGAANYRLSQRASRLEAQIVELRALVGTSVKNLAESDGQLRAQHVEALEQLRRQLEATSAQSERAATQAQQAAKKYSERLAQQIAQEELQRRQQHEQLLAQLGEMRQTSEQSNSQLKGIASEVSGVKSDVSATRSELEKTIRELRSVRGDLGIQSGLIATNARELAALRALGERHYYEFQLGKTKQPQKIGDVAVQLKKSDAKRNRFTIELIADDKRVEKKDRNVNEPVQFYLSNARLPYEIVVNQVQKDKIVGYLAAPKLREPR